MGVFYYCRLLIIIALFFCVKPHAIAQLNDTIAVSDTVIPEGYVEKMIRIAKQSEIRNASNFEMEKISIIQNAIVEAIRKKTQKAKAYLKSGIDTLEIQKEFNTIEDKLLLAGDGVFTNTGTAQTYRNLSTTHKILNELTNRAKAEKSILDNYQIKLDDYIFSIDSLSSNKNLYILPKDSLALYNYLQKVGDIVTEISPVDSMLKQAVASVHDLQKRVNSDVNKLESSIEQIERYQQNLSTKIFGREFNNLGDEIGYARPLNEIINVSRIKGEIILLFYTENNWGKILFTIALILLLHFFLTSLKRILQDDNGLYNDFNDLLILRFPILSATLIVLSMGQFIFPEPPFVFSSLLWVISACCVTVIFWNYITRYWMRIWLVLFTLFCFNNMDNLILQASRTERIGMFLLQFAGVVTGIVILYKGHKRDLKEKLILYFIATMTILELAALFANFYGRYNIAKTLQTSGYTNVIVGILFLWSIRLIDELLSLTYKVYMGKEKRWFYINFEKVGEKTPAFLYLLLGIGWFVLLGRNFYEFKLIADPLKSFLFSERTIGSYTYSVSSLFIFFIIICSALLLSKLVSFFAADKHYLHKNSKKARKPNVGSYVLLIRVCILAIGVLLAFAAVGLPMERIALVLGALGVGIGFGLQTLVNNLVSGLIIAFEKPVNVGDIVEINGQAGVVKSIGFRSSIIARTEGADVVIPNGDLLNAHLINWTLGGNKMRVDVLLHAAYNTDLDKVKSIINDMFIKMDRILKYPAPAVYFKEFSNSSIEIRISFWVNDYNISTNVKSDLIYAIDNAFKENGIAMPIPQQDIHIHTTENNDDKKDEEKTP